METLTILMPLAAVVIPALTEPAVATTRLLAGTGAGGQHTYLRKAWLRKACGPVVSACESINENDSDATYGGGDWSRRYACGARHAALSTKTAKLMQF
jgi:hypothetical protein